jgi:GTPase Era involved in 16S rRNA processing
MSDCSENNFNFIKIRFKVFEKIIEFKIWNIENADFRNNFFSSCQVIFFIYDLFDSSSLNKVKEFNDNLINIIERDNLKYILIGNKSDLNNKNKISSEKINKYINEYKFDLNIEISSLNGENILKLFYKVSQILLNEFTDNPNISINENSTQSNYENKFLNNDAILSNMIRKESYMDEDYKEEVNKINKKRNCYLC